MTRSGSRPAALAAVCVLVGALLLWLALRSDGLDWYICETHADVLYTAARFHELPFFSFAFRGGTYLLQDPQSSLLSPTSLFVLLAGPSLGPRAMALFWGALGCWAYVAWMRRHVAPAAALVGALGWILSLGVAWRIAVGNDMFLWHLALPLFLLAIEDCVRAPRPRSAIALGLALGVFALGPSFHSIVYVLAPALPIFLVVELAGARPDRARLARIAATLTGALVLALTITSPKLVSWTLFEMRRPVPKDLAIGPGDALRALFDYTLVHAAQWHARWGVWESAVALPPPATLLAGLGLVVAVRERRSRVALPAALLVAIGLLFCCSQTAWDLYRHAAGDGIRVAPRMLGIAGFGLSVFAALGADALVQRWRPARPVLTAALVVMVAGFLVWGHVAGQVEHRGERDTVYPQARATLALARRERDQADRLTGFHDLVRYVRRHHDLLDGHGFLDSFDIVGGSPPWRWPVDRQPLPLVEGLPASAVTATHTRIELRGLAAGATAWLRIEEPKLGMRVATEPPAAAVKVIPFGAGVAVVNFGATPVERVVLQVEPPISAAWLGLAAAAILGAAGVLVVRRR